MTHFKVIDVTSMKLTSYKRLHKMNQNIEMQPESTTHINGKVLTYIVVLTATAMQ
jgi:hypothetical protein